jgi:hypothetical protein
MAYDDATSQLVLFGGADAGAAIFSDTWTFDGTDWSQASAGSPPARSEASMAYDDATSQVVLFGGYGGGFLSDTWTFDGTDWTQASPAHSPRARYGATMAYDAATGQVVLFGGNGNSGLLSDTWTYDGTDWTQASPVHSPQASRADRGGHHRPGRAPAGAELPIRSRIAPQPSLIATGAQDCFYSHQSTTVRRSAGSRSGAWSSVR